MIKPLHGLGSLQSEVMDLVWGQGEATVAQLFETIGGPDAEGRKRAMAAMMQMNKLDVAKLQAAYAGKAAA